MKTLSKSAVLLILMIVGALGAKMLTPTIMLADRRAAVELEIMVPEKFGDWTGERSTVFQIVNPQQQKTLTEIYSQVLSRVYVNGNNDRVMLSIAYGRDQRPYTAVHYPEYCYEAQGFSILSKGRAEIDFSDLRLDVKRLETKQGRNRSEPVTYWTTIGNYGALDGLRRRLIELSYGLHGEIPDGLIFRVSSVGQDSLKEFKLQQEFIISLLNSTNPNQRAFLMGTRSS